MIISSAFEKYVARERCVEHKLKEESFKVLDEENNQVSYNTFWLILESLEEKNNDVINAHEDNEDEDHT